jgi:predicted dehydrogenase
MPRREFLKASAGIATAVSAAGLVGGASAQEAEKLRVALIGCGGRGTGAARDVVTCGDDIELYAMGDLFQDRLDGSLARLLKDEKTRDLVNVPAERQFVGFDAYQKVMALDEIDYVLMTTPPGFRPLHFEAAINAGKHAFMEKPVAVCPAGVRKVMEVGKMAEQKGLGVMAGTQSRHSANFIDIIGRIRDGQIGEVRAVACYYHTGGLWHKGREPEWTDAEWQLRNWYYFTWLSGDHLVEQHIHNLDRANWIIGSNPVKCMATGGRQVRTDPKWGHIWDHFAIGYDYADGVKMFSTCRQWEGSPRRVQDYVMCGEGTSDGSSWIRGETEYRHEGKQELTGQQQEHRDMIDSIRAGKPLNVAQRIAESTLTAIMGRMAAYTGKEVTWEQALNSELNLMRDPTEFGPMEVDPVAVPGETELI